MKLRTEEQIKVSMFSTTPIKPNLTVKAVAMKHHLVAQFPSVFGLVDAEYTRLESARKTLLSSDLSDNQKIAKLASIATEVHGKLRLAIENYRGDLIRQKIEFETTVSNLSKPRDSVEAIQQASWSAFLLNSKESLSLISSDPKLAAAALQMPSVIQQSIGISDNTLVVLKEALFPGYLEEMNRYDSLLNNVGRLSSSINEDFTPLTSSPAAINATKQAVALSNL